MQLDSQRHLEIMLATMSAKLKNRNLKYAWMFELACLYTSCIHHGNRSKLACQWNVKNHCRRVSHPGNPWTCEQHPATTALPPTPPRTPYPFRSSASSLICLELKEEYEILMQLYTCYYMHINLTSIHNTCRDSLVAQLVKNSPAMQETSFQFLG